MDIEQTLPLTLTAGSIPPTLAEPKRKRTTTTRTTNRTTNTTKTKRKRNEKAKVTIMGPDTNRAAASGRIAYVFVYNNYTQEQLYELRNTVGYIPEVTYLDFGLEVGESGTPHLQGQIEFNKERM